MLQMLLRQEPDFLHFSSLLYSPAATIQRDKFYLVLGIDHYFVVR